MASPPHPSIHGVDTPDGRRALVPLTPTPLSVETGGSPKDGAGMPVHCASVASASDATEQLGTIESGRTAFLLVQRRDTRVFLQVEKD